MRLVMRLAFLLMLGCLLPGVSVGQNASGPARGVGAVVVYHDNKPVAVLTNSSKKDVASYTFHVQTIYADGRIDPDERLSDFLPGMIASQIEHGCQSFWEGNNGSRRLREYLEKVSRLEQAFSTQARIENKKGGLE